MANWSNPQLTSTYVNFVTEVKDRDVDLALQFDGTTSSSIPTGAIRWNSSINRWQKWNGSVWGELTGTYALTGLSTTSDATIGGTLTATGPVIAASVSGTAVLVLQGGTADGANIELYGGAHPTFANLAVFDANEHRFRSANGAAERMRIDSSGRVGIGTSSPATSLDIGTGGMARVASASGNNQIQVSTGSNGLGMWAGGSTRFYTTGGMIFSVNSTIGTGIPTGYTDAVTIDSSGRVGIGTAAIGAPLHVGSTPTGTSNIYVAPTTAGLAAVEVYNGGSTCGWRTGQRSSSDHDWSLDQMVAGVAYNKFQITATGVLKFDSGYGSTANAYGCRAWVNFNGTGTVAIRASANVSSVTDVLVGQYQVNYTTAMPDANYAIVTDSSDTQGSRSQTYATGSALILTYDTGLIDSSYVSVAVFR